MSFLDAYDGIERVELGRDYWVDLRKFISQGAKEHVETHLQKLSMANGKPIPAPNVVRSRQEHVLASIEEWNLDDDGRTWPINLASVKRLPDPVFALLLERVEEFEERAQGTPQERAQFRGEGLGGDPDGDGGTAEPVDVSDGAGDLEAAGSDEGDVPEAPGA